MVGISTEHFCDSMQVSNIDITINRVYRGLKKPLGERKYAVMYINGASYYIKPIDDDKMGFGSGELDIVFKSSDSEQEIKEALNVFFSKGFGELIGYGGRIMGKEAETDVKKYCEW